MVRETWVSYAYVCLYVVCVSHRTAHPTRARGQHTGPLDTNCSTREDFIYFPETPRDEILFAFEDAKTGKIPSKNIKPLQLKAEPLAACRHIMGYEWHLHHAPGLPEQGGEHRKSR